ncbi:MAG: hypothetical protein LBE31_01900 [Deltaproteobacteria bacterium]|jgi:chemotaxis methyl-accepting protein methylase|nr:hypothetical protein [Deltaproteobacteria bacterium]
MTDYKAPLTIDDVEKSSYEPDASTRVSGVDNLDSSDAELLRQARLYFGRAASFRGQRKLLAIAMTRRQKLDLTAENYLARLRRAPSEWGELWRLYDCLGSDSFFSLPTQFDLLGQLLTEKAILASDRRLKVLSMASRFGHEAYSLAIAISATSLIAKGWKVAIEGFDISQALVKQATDATFKAEDLGFLEPAAAKKWFAPRAGLWRFRTELAPPVSFVHLNYVDIDDSDLESLNGTYDVIFCRGLSFDCPDRLVGRLARTALKLLAPDGLLFNAPGEIWPISADSRYEVREGNIYLRKTPPKSKLNVFFSPKKEGRLRPPISSPPNSSFEDQGGRIAVLAERFHEVLSSDLDEARDLVSEMLALELDQGVVNPKTLSLMLKVEELLGRENCAGYLRGFLEIYDQPQ